MGGLAVGDSIYGQAALGGYDAILVKVTLTNCSVVFVTQYGGAGDDLSSLFTYSFVGYAFVDGMAVSTKDAIIASSFIFTGGTVLPNIAQAQSGAQIAVAMISAANGTLLRYMPDFQYPTGGGNAGMVYLSSIQAFVFHYAQYSGGQPQNQILALIHSNLTSQVVVNKADVNLWRNLVATEDELVTIGTNSGFNSLSGARFSMHNYTSLGSFSFSRPNYHQLVAGTHDPINNLVYATGFSDSAMDDILPCQRGSGSIIVISWNLNNGSVICLSRYGVYGQGFGGGIGIDSSSGTIVVAGLLRGASSVYGDYDAVILTYSTNKTQLNVSIIGSNGCDAAAAVALPYVLLAIPTVPAPNFGSKSGPGLLSIAGIQASLSTSSVKRGATQTPTSSTRFIGKTATQSATSSANQQVAVTLANIDSTSQVMSTDDKFGQLSAVTIAVRGHATMFSELTSTTSNIGGPSAIISETQSVSLIILVAVGFAVLVLCVVALCYSIWYRRRLGMKQRGKDIIKQSYDQETATRSYVDGTHSVGQTTAIQGNTTLAGGSELALPAYLEANEGVDFVIDRSRPPLAEGGGGVIYYAKFQNYGLGTKFVRSGEVEFALKMVKGSSKAVYDQEVSLMHYFTTHPSIINLLAYNGMQMQIAMPLFELGTLSRVLTDLQVNWTFAVVQQLASDIFEAISVVHDAGVIHCDIKSQNYLVKQDAGIYRAVLTDFGVCRVLSSANVVAGLTINSVRGMSLAYSGPEILQRTSAPMVREYEKNRDVYAGAVVMNELATRQMAWKFPRIYATGELTQMVMAGERPSIMPFASLANDQRLPAYQQLVVRGWANSAIDRPTSAEVLAALQSMQ